jgi:hypothetical protein
MRVARNPNRKLLDDPGSRDPGSNRDLLSGGRLKLSLPDLEPQFSEAERCASERRSRVDDAGWSDSL